MTQKTLSYAYWKSEQARGELTELLSDLPDFDAALLKALEARDLSPVYRELTDVVEILKSYRSEIERLMSALNTRDASSAALVGSSHEGRSS